MTNRCCCDRKPRMASAQSFTLWQHATMKFTRRDHSIIACSCRIYMGVVLRAHSVRGELRIQRNANGEVACCNNSLFFTTNRTDRTFFLWRLHLARPSHPSHSTIFVAIGRPERQVRKASHCGSKQQSRSPDEITLLFQKAVLWRHRTVIKNYHTPMVACLCVTESKVVGIDPYIDWKDISYSYYHMRACITHLDKTWKVTRMSFLTVHTLQLPVFQLSLRALFLVYTKFFNLSIRPYINNPSRVSFKQAI